ncbi:hypothetical protein BCR33DRAFT_779180 [Rhizoclosmatium globosum]|uniref:ABC transporter domain-containing protein n=1 Tax=Rhizoclosmatium globosum TaxID=329046 RepID=A0A1Y2D3S6_9FUNG|nr:hypothetical protein BCR33DRAFT_779180 [Rhizoclosmatium globosum]|eukprot:ORY53867.1 hypothetical protein BCR33DRAFT_779180 [Rhizoclosmatium globosum]
MLKLLSQVAGLLAHKNLLQLRRHPFSLVFQTIFAPLLFLSVLKLLQTIDVQNQTRLQSEARDFTPTDERGLEGVSTCAQPKCVTVMYAEPDYSSLPIQQFTNWVNWYNYSVYDGIMSEFVELNNRRLADQTQKLKLEALTAHDLSFTPLTSMGVVKVPSSDFFYNYILANPNTTVFGVMFDASDLVLWNIEYTLWYNATTNRALYGGGLFGDSVLQMTREKESQSRSTLETIGLQPGAYFLAHMISYTIIIFLNSLATTILGQYIFQFDMFVRTSPVVLVLTFGMFGEAMVSLSLLLSCFVATKAGAGVVGVFVLVLGFLCQTFLFSGEQFGYIWWSNVAGDTFWKCFSIIPFFNFGKLFLDISVYTTGKLNPVTNTVPSARIRRRLCSKHPPPSQSLWLLAMNVGVFFCAAWYFDKVIPGECGAKMKPWFLFTKKYWFPAAIESTPPPTVFGSSETVSPPPTLEQIQKSNPAILTSVIKSINSIFENVDAVYTPPPITLEIKNLCKSFTTRSLVRKWRKHRAVDDLSLTLESGKLFALLGQSGAGKTTTTNILCGKTPQSSGSIRIWTAEDGRERRALSDLIGVCPQHDVLFHELTAREHVYLYARIKNVQVENAGIDILKAVNLEKVADSAVGTYSGGMKRRLSLTLSTLGQTRLLFLDEPTTGLDPVNRSHVQRFIQTLKQDRIVILTTHSMEEADVLADEVGIMVSGKLVECGAPWELKRRYLGREGGGAGRRVSVAVSGTDAQVLKVKNQVLEVSKFVSLEDEMAGALVFRVVGGMEGVKKVVEFLENEADVDVVKAWGISGATLEDVFIETVKKYGVNGKYDDESKNGIAF